MVAVGGVVWLLPLRLGSVTDILNVFLAACLVCSRSILLLVKTTHALLL